MKSGGVLHKLAGEFRLFGVLLLLMVGLSIVSDRFLTVDNLTNVLWSVCLIGIMATGAIYSPVTGGIDLSVGSMAALAGILANVFMNTFGLHWTLAIVLTLVIGAAIGWLNGIVTTKFLVPAFIVTMAAKTYLFGLAMLISNGDQITIMEPKPFLEIGVGKFLGIPIPIYIMMLLVVASHVLLKHTAFGRRAIAVGANEVAAKLTGVNPDKTRIIVYTISSVTATIAGIVMASLTQQAYAMNASGYELDVITAIVVGGTSLMGGNGSVIGALIGAVMVGFINNGLNLLDMPSAYHPIATGIVILVALILNQGSELASWLKRLRTLGKARESA
ncbi:ABC transporter permease [uncultured Propionivibrio sp.]|uniref:ABC transporter permease n=1 Tax=uncultured Propionivibrio sp. TaxID=426737 RepID=UPI0029C08E79|nr:ABC transporter permease [uncultured Propionivibrio sp.]